MPTRATSRAIRTRPGRSGAVDGCCALRKFAGHRLRRPVPALVGGHAAGGFAAFAEDELAHGQAGPTFAQYLASPRFWFESFQNWQSEFLSIAAMVWLSVYLRQRWSPESKPVHAPHDETGR